MAHSNKRFAEQSEDDLRSEMHLLSSQQAKAFKTFKASYIQRPYETPSQPTASMQEHRVVPSHADPLPSWHNDDNTGQPPTKRVFRGTIPAAESAASFAHLAAPRMDHSWDVSLDTAMDSGVDSPNSDVEPCRFSHQWRQYMQLREQLEDT
eukprot:m.60273 g.60273  ORF g.60273 m.60273 type:complete len:151 (-) comp13847_c1_seq1:86-538(-)